MTKETKKSNDVKGAASRKQALQILMKIESGKAYSNIALSSQLEKSELSTRDKALVTCLVQGVVRNRDLLDSKIKLLSNKPIEKMSRVLVNILRMGIFQLDFLDDMPPSAIVNTSTHLARKMGHVGLSKFTNAILRTHIRNKEKTVEVEGESGDLSSEQLATKFSMPIWIVDRWLKNYGYEESIALLKYSIEKPSRFIRVNSQAITREGLKTLLSQEGVQTVESLIVPDSLKVESIKKGIGKLEDLPSYKEGLFSIQDEAASLVSHIVAPKENEVVLDLCAAPGGKTLHMAELMDNTGKIIACDLYENRLDILKKNMSRLNLTNIKIVAADGSKITLDEKVDKVLLDAPCSGTGVLNRKSDIKYKKQEKDIHELAKIQRALLDHAVKLLKPGGEIVYATCSVEPEENIMVVEKFVNETPEVKFESIQNLLPENLAHHHELTTTAEKGFVQLRPSINNLSGFFIAKIKKGANQNK